ncbi:Plasmodium exported protein (PHISTa), unknown, putative [Plasmodium sp.]|nr:Plasmodium exported protein (PHISTa), unknown, putative [Plasmodium sp.]
MSIIIFEKSETFDSVIFDIYRRNLSDLKNVQNSWLRSRSENNEFKNCVDEKVKLKNIVVEKGILKNSVEEKVKLKIREEENVKLKNTEDEKVQLKNFVDEKTNNNSLSSECSNGEVDVKYTKDGFDDMLRDLSYYIDDYLLKCEYQRYDVRDTHKCLNTMYRIWNTSMHNIGVALSSTDMEYTIKFYNLVKGGGSIDEMNNFINLYIKYYGTLKNDLFNKHIAIFTEKMKNPQ